MGLTGPHKAWHGLTRPHRGYEGPHPGWGKGAKTAKGLAVRLRGLTGPHGPSQGLAGASHSLIGAAQALTQPRQGIKRPRQCRKRPHKASCDVTRPSRPLAGPHEA